MTDKQGPTGPVGPMATLPFIGAHRPARLWNGDWATHKPIAETLEDVWEDLNHARGAELGDTQAMFRYIYFLEQTLADLHGPYSAPVALIRAFADELDIAAHAEWARKEQP